MYGLYLIAVLVVTGGAIAFIGDRLGTKIGKKRLSIFGLRPRHTSNVITVITGFVITALTIGIMSATSENVRTALFGMEELNATLESKQQELNKLSDELSIAKSEYQTASEDLQNSKTEVEQLQQEQLALREESNRLRTGNEKLELANANLIYENENLSNANNNLSASNDSLTADNKSLTESNATLVQSNSDLKQSNDQLTNDNQELENRNENLRNGLMAIREGDIVFRAGEILASGVIRGGNRDVDDIVKDIDNMAQAATMVISRRIGNNADPSVWIYQPELTEAVQKISASPRDMVLRIAAAGNLVRGEPVRTNLELYENDKIYSKDEFILSRVYEIQDTTHAEQIIQHFLIEVNRTAVSKGILSDPLTGAVGVMEGSQLYQLIETISKTKGKFVLTAYSREDTEVIGPLRLNIKIEDYKKGLNL